MMTMTSRRMSHFIQELRLAARPGLPVSPNASRGKNHTESLCPNL